MTDESTLGRRSRPTLRAPRACLRVVHSPDAAAVGRTLDLDAAHTLGRQGPSGFADARMSREHARLYRAAAWRRPSWRTWRATTAPG
jgi:hypothetical protein